MCVCIQNKNKLLFCSKILSSSFVRKRTLRKNTRPLLSISLRCWRSAVVVVVVFVIYGFCFLFCFVLFLVVCGNDVSSGKHGTRATIMARTTDEET